MSQFRAKTLTKRNLVREMLFASAVVAHSSEEIQKLIDRFAHAAAQFSLKINIKKTECLYQPVKQRERRGEGEGEGDQRLGQTRREGCSN